MIFFCRKKEELIEPALAAGMILPDNIDRRQYGLGRRDCKYFYRFCDFQLNIPMPNIHCVWHNACVVAKIPKDHLYDTTWPELKKMGFIGIW